MAVEDQHPDERADDEAHEEWEDRLLRANLKESFDIHRGDDRAGFRGNRQHADMLFADYMEERAARRRQTEMLFEATLRQQEEHHQQRMRFAEELFTTRQRGQHQADAHRDHANSTQIRDQLRDSAGPISAVVRDAEGNEDVRGSAS